MYTEHNIKVQERDDICTYTAAKPPTPKMLSPDIRNSVDEAGIISSSIDHVWQQQPVTEGSFYLEMVKTIGENLSEAGDWVLLHNVLTGETMRVTEVMDLATRYAVLFQREGLREGDFVHVVLGNENHTFSMGFATWLLGGVFSVGDVNLEARAVAQQIEDTNAKLLVCKPEIEELATAAAALSGSEGRTKVLCLGESQTHLNVLEEVKRTDPGACPEPYRTADVGSEVAACFWSSGTTGRPKGICLTHHSLNNYFGGFLHMILKKGINQVTTTCFFHVGGFFTGLYAMMKRGTYYHMFGRSFTLDHLVKAILEAQPRTITIGSHHYVHLAESDVLDSVDPEGLACVRVIVPTGASVPECCEGKLRRKLKGLQTVVNMYGATEAGLISGGDSSRDLGMLYPQVKAKVENLHSGETCGPAEVGEICVLTPGLMKEYLKRPKDTEDYFTPDGFGRTGDIGYYDERGFIYYLDRIKEIIKYKNNHVAPTEIEGLFQKHPAVKESLVFGRPCPIVQELISAVVVLKKGMEATERELLEFVNGKVTAYKQIRGGIIFRDAIPRNSVGKLLRREMRDWAREQADSDEAAARAQ